MPKGRPFWPAADGDRAHIWTIGDDEGTEPERSGREPPQRQARSMTQGRTDATPCPIRFTRAICGDLAQAERREWWITNGLGAYAGGTIAGSLTRRYHGLLIAPIASPLGRRL